MKTFATLNFSSPEQATCQVNQSVWVLSLLHYTNVMIQQIKVVNRTMYEELVQKDTWQALHVMINKSFTPEPPIFCCLNSVRNPINASFSFTFCQQIAVFIECDITPPFLLFLCVTQLTPQLNTIWLAGVNAYMLLI